MFFLTSVTPVTLEPFILKEVWRFLKADTFFCCDLTKFGSGALSGITVMTQISQKRYRVGALRNHWDLSIVSMVQLLLLKDFCKNVYIFFKICTFFYPSVHIFVIFNPENRLHWHLIPGSQQSPWQCKYKCSWDLKRNEWNFIF